MNYDPLTFHVTYIVTIAALSTIATLLFGSPSGPTKLAFDWSDEVCPVVV